jgi:hypothetical protein
MIGATRILIISILLRILIISIMWVGTTVRHLAIGVHECTTRIAC